MERLQEASTRWVREGHITEAQRAAILASEASGPKTIESKTPSMTLRREGPAAEIFVFVLGGCAALLAALVTLFAGDPALTNFIYAGGALAAVGVALLIGIRGGSLLADVAFAGTLWLVGAAAVNPTDADWRYMAPFVAPLIVGIGLIRILRMVIVVPAMGLTYVYAIGAIPAMDTRTIFVGFLIVVLAGSVIISFTRQRVRRWVRNHFGKQLAPKVEKTKDTELGAPADPSPGARGG